MEKTAHVAEYKKKIVQNIVKCVKEYPIIGVANMENLPAPQLQAMRAKLRGKVYLIMTKKRLMKIALEQVKNDKKDIENLEKYFEGMAALLFTKDSPFKLSKTLQESKSPAPAKAGQTAPKDLIIPKGPTGFAPGPIISELSSVGIKTGVEQGKVAVKEDSLVAKKGEKIEPKVAEVLTRMGIEPMEVGLDLIAAYDDGVIYPKDILLIDEKEFMGKLNSACSGAFNLAMFIEYPTKDTINVLLGKAFNDAKAIGLSQNIIDEGVIEALLGKAETGMLSLKDVAKIEVKEKPKEEKKEEPKPEEKKAEVKEELKIEEKKEEVKAEEKPKEKPVVKEEKKIEEPKPEVKEEPKVEEVKKVSETQSVSDDAQKAKLSDKPEPEVKPEEKKEVPKPEERKEILKTEEKPAEEPVVEKEILDEEKQIEKKTEEEVKEKPEEKEVKEAVKEETEKELEKEKPESKEEVKEVKPVEAPKTETPEPEKAEDVYEKEERQELTAEGGISPAEEGFMEGYEEAGKTEEKPEEEKPEADVDDKVKKMVEETKKFVAGDKGPSADDLIGEVEEEEKEVKEKSKKEKKEEEPKVEEKPKKAEKKEAPEEKEEEKAEEKKEEKKSVPSAHELAKKKGKDEQKEVEDLAKELIKKGTLRK